MFDYSPDRTETDARDNDRAFVAQQARQRRIEEREFTVRCDICGAKTRESDIVMILGLTVCADPACERIAREM